MKKLNIILLILAIPFIGFAQKHNCKHVENRLSHEELRAEKVAYITTKMDLTVEEAQVFWPIYNAFQNEIEEVIQLRHDNMRKLRKNAEPLSDEELEKVIDLLVDLDLQEANIKSKYHKDLKKVLSTRKISLLYRSEHSFRKHLLEKYRNKRHNNRPPMHE